MYIYMYIYMYIHMYIICTYICTYVRTYRQTDRHADIQTYRHAYIHVCAYLYWCNQEACFLIKHGYDKCGFKQPTCTLTPESAGSFDRVRLEGLRIHRFFRLWFWPFSGHWLVKYGYVSAAPICGCSAEVWCVDSCASAARRYVSWLMTHHRRCKHVRES